MNVKAIFSFLTGVLALSIQVSAMKADLSQSVVTWYGEKITGYHYGDIKLKSADLKVENGNLTGGSFEVDMTQMTCDDISDKNTNEKLIGHLKSDDFFSVEKHPTAKFVISKVTPFAQASAEAREKFTKALGETNKRKFTKVKVESPTHVLSGSLTIKGKSQNIEFPAHVKMNEGTLEATALMVVDRTNYDVRYGSKKFFDNLGNRVIYDDFEVGVKIAAK